eukprot:1897658-Prymnesium_polylepis.1
MERRLRELHKVAEHRLHRGDVDLLADDAVLDEAVLGRLALAHLDAQVEEPRHDLLDRRLPRAVALGREDIVQRDQSGILLADGHELVRAFERIFRLRKVHHGLRARRVRKRPQVGAGASSDGASSAVLKGCVKLGRLVSCTA